MLELYQLELGWIKPRKLDLGQFELAGHELDQIEPAVLELGWS